VYIFICTAYYTHADTRHTATSPSVNNEVHTHSFNIQYNSSKEKYVLPEDDRIIETYRSVLSVLM